MALSIDRKTDHIRVLSDLSEDVVGALLDEGERTPSEGDPFAAALRRYQQEGHPEELAGPWRHVLAAPPVVASGHAANVLRLLARDLLSCVAARGAEPESAEPEPEAPANVRPISGGPAAPVPALELARDGTWRPSTASGVVTDTDVPRHRQAHVPSMSSRYPAVRADGPHVVLPAPPSFVSAPPSPTPPPPVSASPSSASPSSASPLPTLPPATAHEPPAAAPTPPPTKAHEPSPAAPTPRPTAPAAPATPAAPTPRPAAPTAPSTEAHQDESVIQAVSGGTEIVAGPFARFKELAAFTKALRELPGVQSVTIRQFVRGLVHIRVRHSSTMDLAAGLLTLTDFSPSIVSSTASRIELRVASSDDVPPSRD